MKPPFRYPDEDWRAIEASLMKLVPHAAAGAFVHWRARIEATMDAYLYRMTYFDPRSPTQIEVKACWAKIAKHAHALNTAVDKLEAIDPWRTGVLRHVIVFATDPATPPADYQVWKKQNAEAVRLAAREAKGFKKSTRGTNRSRGRAVDHLFFMLLMFWLDGGGRIGKGSNSPSTRFVAAAAGRVLSTTVPHVRLPGAVVDYVRVGFRTPNTSL